MSTNTNTMTVSFKVTRLLTGCPGEAGGQAVAQMGRRVGAEWLPVAQAAPRVQSGRGVEERTSIWIPLERETIFEKLFLGLLTVSAAVAIAGGFSAMLSLVENWSVFNGWVSRLVE
ncbi:MAG: hypothetical protein NTX27_10560 [Verrucomicrobia bacterium]|nr:hypothetical protein [Verrucomicrobiota bacterium]